jgi:hypothetical protein
VVVADFNGDGKLDIAASNLDTNTVAVFLNDGTGNFASPIVTTVVITNGLGTLAGGTSMKTENLIWSFLQSQAPRSTSSFSGMGTEPSNNNLPLEIHLGVCRQRSSI